MIELARTAPIQTDRIGEIMADLRRAKERELLRELSRMNLNYLPENSPTAERLRDLQAKVRAHLRPAGI